MSKLEENEAIVKAVTDSLGELIKAGTITIHSSIRHEIIARQAIAAIVDYQNEVEKKKELEKLIYLANKYPEFIKKLNNNT